MLNEFDFKLATPKDKAICLARKCKRRTRALYYATKYFCRTMHEKGNTYTLHWQPISKLRHAMFGARFLAEMK